MNRPITTIVAVLALIGLVGGCGGADSDRTSSPQRVTLVLDYLPNAVHAGIARAQEAGYYRDRGIDLRVIAPTSTADTLKLIGSGRALIGLADGIDLAQQIDRGEDAQAILAIVQRPLGGVVSLEKVGIDRPRELEGKRVGITGIPSDNAVLDTIVRSDGGDPAKVRTVTVGFGGVAALENGKIDAFVGYYPADGVQVEHAGRPVRVFAFDEHGGPRYPGLVAFSTREAIDKDHELIGAFVEATVEGYEDAVQDPEAALGDLVGRYRGLDRSLTSAQLDAYGPLFVADAGKFGQISAANVTGLSRFLMSEGLIAKSIMPERFYDKDLTPSR